METYTMDLSNEIKMLGLVLHNSHYYDRLLQSGITTESIQSQLGKALFDGFAECRKRKLEIDIVNMFEFLPLEVRQEYCSIVEVFPVTMNIDFFIEKHLDEWSDRRTREIILDQSKDPLERGRLIQEETTRIASGLKQESDINAIAYDWENYVQNIMLGKREFISTGFPKIDDIFQLEPGGLYVIGARPGVGKTALAINLVANAIAKKNKTIFGTIEMPTTQIFNRLVCLNADVPGIKIRNNRLTDNEVRSLLIEKAKLVETSLEIYDDFKGIWGNLESKVRFSHTQIPVKLLVIDHLAILKLNNSSNMDRVREISELTGAIKRFALELKIPTILCCQLNRELDKREGPPRLSDLRGSGAIEQDADVVLFIHRKPEDEIGEFIIAKNRHGRTGRVGFRINPGIGRFSDHS
jgi:replicative DNA helicase